MPMQVHYDFQASVWRYNAASSWFFVSLPSEFATEIRQLFGKAEEGFGRMPVSCTIGQTTWKTAIWFDTKRNGYLLPLKSKVRIQESIQEDQTISVRVSI